MNLIDQFLGVVQRHPAAPALIHQGQVMTRGQFLKLVVATSRHLHEQGVAPGEVMGMSLDHSPLHLAAMLAVARLGAVSLPVHPATPPAGQQRLMAKFGASRLICMPDAQVPPGVPAVVLDAAVLKPLESADLRFIPYWPAPETPARIGLTSGTTGMPGGILYTHAYWGHRIATTVDNCDAQTRLMPSNLHLTLGNLSAFAALLSGGMVVFNRLHDIRSYFQTVQLYGVTHALMAPALIAEMATLNTEPGPAFPSMRHLRMVGGALTRQQIAIAKTRLSPNISLPYGLSEVGAVSIASPDLLTSHPEFAGRCKPGVLVQALGPNGEVLAVGQTGELRVKVPGMPQSYYRDEVRTADRFVDGWFMTRDIGMVTSDGLVRIEGRADDRLNIGGQKLHPEQIESVLQQHPEVKEVAVFVADNALGNKVLMAAIVLNHSGAVQRKFTDYCRDMRMGRQAPQRFLLVPQLPRNPAGKLIRTALPELLSNPGQGQTLH
ncbi:class I adenylate-forming enzyme family protein [Aquabacterium sp.]|uniref:class I adenylate-forming enzyme family protein n=1 Tax=Aquabacterium sp. TaxID=1872578 RepID=UPI003B6AA99B